jgi:hypothetical protein
MLRLRTTVRGPVCHARATVSTAESLTSKMIPLYFSTAMVSVAPPPLIGTALAQRHRTRRVVLFW